MRSFFLILFAGLLLTGCKKNTETGDCVLLKQGMEKSDVQQVGKVIDISYTSGTNKMKFGNMHD